MDSTRIHPLATMPLPRREGKVGSLQKMPDRPIAPSADTRAGTTTQNCKRSRGCNNVGRRRAEEGGATWLITLFEGFRNAKVPFLTNRTRQKSLKFQHGDFWLEIEPPAARFVRRSFVPRYRK